jgi:hypothetical protein
VQSTSRKPPFYCRLRGKEIPYKEEISPIRDVLKESSILLNQGDSERASTEMIVAITGLLKIIRCAITVEAVFCPMIWTTSY